MRSWLHGCLEHAVVQKHGNGRWREILSRVTETDIGQQSFSSIVVFIRAASDVLHLGIDQFLEVLISHLAEFAFSRGFGDDLSDKDITLQTWLRDINSNPNHLLSSCFSDETNTSPEYHDEAGGYMYLRCISRYGLLLAPLVIGIVQVVAQYRFDTEVKIHVCYSEEVADGTLLKWRIAVGTQRLAVAKQRNSTNTSSGMQCRLDRQDMVDLPQTARSHEQSCLPRRDAINSMKLSSDDRIGIPSFMATQTGERNTIASPSPVSLSGTMAKEIFPYHIITDREFRIIQIGRRLPLLLKRTEKEMIGSFINTTFVIIEPVHVAWDWKSLRKIIDQAFYLKPQNVKRDLIRLRASMVELSTDPYQVMFILSPDVKRPSDLKRMNLTLKDLPSCTSQRETIVIRNKCAHDVLVAHKLDVLTKKLCSEQLLSRGLLRTMVPRHVMELLKKGEPVTPQSHENVTMIFCDVAGYEAICEEVHPLHVIGMLNQVYCVLEYLCKKFNVFQVEMEGDEFFGCCGLLTQDTNHAVNVANFAIAAGHCIRQVQSPVDGSPIQLCIGIHTGQCMSGVVGMTSPRFKVFGDTVNTTSRHKSTCDAGKIQCSSKTIGMIIGKDRLFNIASRGFVEMKGKGQMFTYWLDGGTENNHCVDSEALARLELEIADLLRGKTFINSKEYVQSWLERNTRWSRSDSIESSLVSINS